MAFKGLADFLEELAATGQLVRVAAEVDADLEIAEITRRVAAADGPAILFERVRGQSLPVLTNLLGTTRRACTALGVDSLDDLPDRLEAIAARHTPQNWFDRLKMPGGETGIEKLRPKIAKAGLSQQVVHLGRDVNLANLPLLRTIPGETGPAIRGGVLLTPSLGDSETGLSHLTLVVLDENRLAVVNDGRSAFAQHWSKHRDSQQPMPVAIVLGGDPAALLAAHWVLPSSLEIYHLIGMLRGKPIELVKCRTHDLLVPCEAELVLEGFIEPETQSAEVAIGGAGGMQLTIHQQVPILHVSAISHRHRPIFSAVVDCGPQGESAVLYKARERLLLPTLRVLASDLVDISLPLLGGASSFAFVSMRKQFPHQARQLAAALLGSEALPAARFLVLLDAEVDVHDLLAVWEQVGANANPELDVFHFDGPACYSPWHGSQAPLMRHLAIDATTKLPAERPATGTAKLSAGEEIRRQVTARWSEFCLDDHVPPVA